MALHDGVINTLSAIILEFLADFWFFFGICLRELRI